MSLLDSSILNDVKKALGLEGIDNFDTDVILFINSALNNLTLIGVGPDTGMTIDGDTSKWSDFFTDPRLSMVKEYVYLTVKLSFDGNGSATLMQQYKDKRDELAWYIRELADPDRHGFDLKSEES